MHFQKPTNVKVRKTIQDRDEDKGVGKKEEKKRGKLNIRILL